VRVTDLGVDLLSLAGHKLYAPKGVGALYVRQGVKLEPLIHGAGHEGGRRAGTESALLAVGLGAACALAQRELANSERIGQLRDRLWDQLHHVLGAAVVLQGHPQTRLPNTLNVSCHYVEGEAMLYQLSDCGICASSDSACTSGSLEPSHVLRAMHVPFTAVHGSVRFSFSRYNTQADVEQIIQVFPQIVANLRKLSPYWDQEHNRPRGDATQSTCFPRALAQQVAGQASG